MRLHATLLRTAAVVALTLAGTAPLLAAEPPAGMVMRVNGGITPPLANRAEMPENETVKLDPDARLTFLHYGACHLVTVTGGSVTLGKQDFTVDGGKVESDTAGPCPKMHRVASATAGAVVMRSLGGAQFPDRPDFALVGARAGQVATADIYRDGQLDAPVVSLTVADRGAHLPTGAAALQPSQRYVLKLRAKDHSEVSQVAFTATTSGADAPMVILRLD